MTEQLVHIQLDKAAKLNCMWINHPVSGDVAHRADFGFNNRVKDNILGLFKVGDRAVIMSVLSSAYDDDLDAEVVKAFAEAYGTAVNEPATVVGYAVLLDHDLFFADGDVSPGALHSTIYSWKAGTDEKLPFLEIYRTEDECRRAVGVGVFEGLELDDSVLDFLHTVKLVTRPPELPDVGTIQEMVE